MKYGKLSARLCRSAAAGAILTAIGAGAFAQQATNNQVIQTTPPAEDEQTASASADTVVITGSRLRNEFTSSSPMDVIVADEAASQGLADVAQLLRATTVAAGSPQITAVTSTAFVQDGGIGVESLSLRGLGANRTLVLLDGRRAGPAGTRGAVSAFDFNVLPLSVVDRVEILKDGASSIYGSDAVAGVVNIITKKGPGADFDMSYHLPEHGGGDQLRVSGSWGEDIGNFSFRLTGDYYRQTELDRKQRDYLDCAEPMVYRADGSRADLVDPRTNTFTCSGDLLWGHIWFYDYTQPGAISRPWRARPQLVQYDYDGNLGNWLPGLGPNASGFSFPTGWFPVGYGELSLPGQANDPFYSASARLSDALLNYNHPFVGDETLSPEVERMTVMGNGEWRLNDGLTLYAEALLNRRMTKADGYRQFWTYQYVYDYGYPYQYGDPIAIAEGWLGPATGLSPTAITDHSDNTISVDYMRFVGGARGALPFAGWEFDVAAQFSRSDGDYKQDVIWDDAITPYLFRNSLCAGTTTPYRGVPCVDVNWYTPDFQRGYPTQAERDFMFGSVTGNTVYEQMSIEGFITGDLFQLPAGAVGAVFGAAWQNDEINDVPSQAMQDGELWGTSSAGITAGEDTTQSLYTELGIPLLKGLPFAQDVSLTASARYTDVDSYGADTTYKVGLNWQILDSLRLRASQGTSFRSPALFELFLSGQTSFLGQRVIDPCINWQSNLAVGAINQRIADNCAADGIPGAHLGAGSSATISSSGGFGTLEAETSLSRSIGLIWQPAFIDLQMSIDYFDIDIENEVTQLGASNIVRGCYASDNFATEPLCNLFNRNPPGGATQYLITDVTNNFLNIATQRNRGIDFEALYRHETAWGPLTLRAQASKQLEDEFQLLPSSAPQDFTGEIGEPEWVANFGAQLDHGPFEFNYTMQYVGETSNVASFGSQSSTYYGEPIRYILSTDSVIYHTASVNIEPADGFNVRVGVRNLFDEKPPQVSNGTGEYSTIGNVPVVSQYDFFGRTFFVNLSKKY